MKKLFLRRIILFVFISLIISGLIAISFYAYKEYNQRIKNEQKTKIIEALANEAFKECEKSSFWRHCYEVRIEKFAKTHDMPILLGVLEKLQTIDEKTKDCHTIAHAISKQALLNHPQKWKEYVSLIDTFACNYGFVHGIIEARSFVDETFVLNEKTIPEICDEFASHAKRQGLDQTCAHVMGHIVLVEKDGIIPEAIDVCKKTPSQMQKECFAGAFMENFTRNNLVTHGIAEFVPWDDDTIQKQETICREYTATVALSCWQEVSHLYNYRTWYKPALVYEQCQIAKQEEFVNNCYIHAVVTLAQNKDADKEYLLELCAPLENKPAYNSCLNVAIRSLVYANVTLTERALLLCDAVLKGYKESCYQVIGHALKLRATPSDKIFWCNKAPSDYRKYCINAQV